MAGNTVATLDLAKRAEVWGAELKEILRDELQGMKYVNWLDSFPDGDTFKIPSIGDATLNNYSEDTAVTYDPIDDSQFTFSITEYLQSGNYITNKAMQDVYYANEIMSQFVPLQERALMERVETDIMALGGQQTLDNGNAINGVDHRMLGSGTGNKIGVEDFAKALRALKTGKVPQKNLVAIVDPSVEYELNTLSQLTNVSNNPRWEGVVRDGIATGMSFVANIYGFDVYTSNYLKTEAAETIGGTTVNNAITNMFFSADQTVLPFVGAWRQMPKVDTEYNKDFQRTEFVTTARYGLKLFRPENLATVLTAPMV
ncbi:major capsid protein [Lentibacter phage vB_LenP_ICBM1]|uniref:Major capsid protein n=2 Tax=Siovirus germanense TaxID=2845497 RepID=A0A3G2YR79_9CAUD|nr:major capsid protein [Lentibacter phage vB_LenP_ICBM1]AYP28018.1 hypothetical protein [Lentibacter phage vB_LenP_ICBM3]AYP28158.1 major capsid protein [Lentibacter phage vB_LenP_ICBM1]